MPEDDRRKWLADELRLLADRLDEGAIPEESLVLSIKRDIHVLRNDRGYPIRQTPNGSMCLIMGWYDPAFDERGTVKL